MELNTSDAMMSGEHKRYKHTNTQTHIYKYYIKCVCHVDEFSAFEWAIIKIRLLRMYSTPSR